MKITIPLTVEVVGTIQSHLSGLLGNDAMFYELLQNADDAEAKEIFFDFRHKELRVWNSGVFQYCGDLKESNCPLQQAGGKKCDFHSISKMASRGKAEDSDNIGRFGIGFVSTYQICDTPEIESVGKKLKLDPTEAETCTFEDVPKESGTLFRLPWASDPKSGLRKTLHLSPITDDYKRRCLKDCKTALPNSLLFLKHTTNAQIKKNGKTIFSLEVDRDEDKDPNVVPLILSSGPNSTPEQWFIYQYDATAAIKPIYKEYPELETQKRKTQVSVAFRTGPNPLTPREGLLYAFLPTRKQTRLPIHVNADFFPESSRKTIISEDDRYQGRWNKTLIETAAKGVASDLERIRDEAGIKYLWDLLESAYEIVHSKHSPREPIFKCFWDSFRDAAEQGAEIGLSEKNEYKPLSELVSSRKTLSEQEVNVFHEIGGELLSSSLTPHQPTTRALGVKPLTLEKFVAIAKRNATRISQKYNVGDSEQVEQFFIPLWRLVEDLLPNQKSEDHKVAIEDLKQLRLLLNHDSMAVAIDSCYTGMGETSSVDLSKSFPWLDFVNDRIKPYKGLLGLIGAFDIGCVVNELRAACQSDEKKLLETLDKDDRLRELYLLISSIDEETTGDHDEAYEGLKKLPIWKTGSGISTLEGVLLPGDFDDPIGQSRLLDSALLPAEVSDFLEKKLGVNRQSIKEYVRTVVPKLFEDDGPEDTEQYQRLLLALAQYPQLLDDDETLSILQETRLVPRSDGAWNTADKLYRRSDELVNILGDNKSLWVDHQRFPGDKTAVRFIENLGLLTSPNVDHLVDRILAISKASPPDTKARKKVEVAFYQLCQEFEENSSEPQFDLALDRLKHARCLPAAGENNRWFEPRELYAYYSEKAFFSQASILDFKNNQKLEQKLLNELSIKIRPSTKLIVDHLLHCMEQELPVDQLVYRVLNGRIRDEEKHTGQLEILKGKPCIYLSAKKKFVRPNQVYFEEPNLRTYAYKISDQYLDFRGLFRELGVKDSPSPDDYIEIVIDIVETHFQKESRLSNEDYELYSLCLKYISEAKLESDNQDVERLADTVSVVNLDRAPKYPSDVLLDDCEWVKSTFSAEELEPILCKVDPAIWELFQSLGVERLSKSITRSLVEIQGREVRLESEQKQIRERLRLFERILHEQPNKVVEEFLDHIANLSLVRYDVIKVKTTVDLSGSHVLERDTSTPVFLDQNESKLLLGASAFDSGLWIRVFQEILPTLIPSELISDLSTLSFVFDMAMTNDVQAADYRLTAGGYPQVQSTTSTKEKIDMKSPEMGEIGESDNQIEEEEEPVREISDSENQREEHTGQASVPEIRHPTHNQRTPAAPSDTEPPDSIDVKEVGPSTNRNPFTPRESGEQKSTGASRRPKSGPKNRGINRKLISYVKQRLDEGEAPNKIDNEHKNAIEVKSRERVCAYEKARGREPEEMSQTHPGYDIKSRKIGAEEVERYIEVKATSGEWSGVGVSLSSRQFQKAQEQGENYWLYVVERVFDDDLFRIHPIQNPANAIDSFQFDHGWKAAVSDEQSDPTLRFQVGVMIEHKTFGRGRIEKIDNRGVIKEYTIDFERRGAESIALNLKFMSIVEEEDELDYS